MKPLRVKTPSALNNPNRWNRYLRPWFDVQSYQARIDARVGLNRDGRSLIRLVWAQDINTDAYGASQPRYWTKRKRLEGGKWDYYRVARWIFERRLEPEQFVPAWEASRYAMTDEEGCTVDKGDPPTEWYTFAMECTTHTAIDPSDGWPGCCTRAFYTDTKWGGPRSRCWGEYKTPGDFELMVLSQAVRKMESEKFSNPYAPISRAELEEAEAAAGMQVERANEQFAALEADMARDFYRLHGWRLTETDPTVLHHGRLHDIGASFQKRGDIYTPKESLHADD